MQLKYMVRSTQTLRREKMALQEYKETGGEKWDYEDTPQYWQQRDAEEKIILNEMEQYGS